MKTCNNCGREFADKLTKCPACGTLWVDHAADGTVPPPALKKSVKGRASNLMKHVDEMDDDSVYRMAVGLREGINGPQNVEQAKELFYVLAMRGNHDGMFGYAQLCLKEDPADLKTAVHWLFIAAQEGHISSRLKLLELSAAGMVNVEGGLPAKDIFREIAPAAPAPRHDESAFEAVVRGALPFVVAISAEQRKGRLLGSGFVIEGGYVVTNAHVVGEYPQQVTARFEPDLDAKTYNLQILAVVPAYDIAVLKFTGLMGERVAERGGLKLRLDSAGYGEDVFTIGNPLGIGLSVCKGVVSSPNRESSFPPAVETVIQTDMTVNHGNSGGALLDKYNSVLGVITYVPGESDGGIAMCVPAKYIVKVLNEI